MCCEKSEKVTFLVTDQEGEWPGATDQLIARVKRLKTTMLFFKTPQKLRFLEMNLTHKWPVGSECSSDTYGRVQKAEMLQCLWVEGTDRSSRSQLGDGFQYKWEITQWGMKLKEIWVSELNVYHSFSILNRVSNLIFIDLGKNSHQTFGDDASL